MDYNIPTPSEIQYKLNESAEAEVEKIVPQIIEELESKYDGDSVTFSLKDRELSSKARARVITIFSEVGWNVKFQDTQREGAWLEFRAATANPL